MKLTPKSAAEIAAERLIKPGVYRFHVVAGADDVSGAGHEMIRLALQILDDQGAVVARLTDYLTERTAARLRQCAECCGLLDHYEAGELNGADFTGKEGCCRVVVQKASGAYPARNVIAAYVTPRAAQESAREAAAIAAWSTPAKA